MCGLGVPIQPARLREVVDGYRRGKHKEAWLIMRLINLETWLRGLSPRSA